MPEQVTQAEVERLRRKLAKDRSDFMVAREQTDVLWLAEQLCEWPHRRVDPNKTMSDTFLRYSAAQSLLSAADELSRMREALAGLEKAATEVSRQGAVTGPQWHRLTTALLYARSRLAQPPSAKEPNQ